jgi:hypothetical protein
VIPATGAKIDDDVVRSLRYAEIDAGAKKYE